MKKIRLLLVFTMMTSLGFSQLEMPLPSPHATFKQTIGLTDITIEYSSPGVKDRTIWGDLVSYDEIWRMGANQSTTITFGHDVVIDGDKELEAGTYSLGAIPTEEGDWTLIFSNNTDLGGWGDYNEEEDALRIAVSPQWNESSRERLLFCVSDFDFKAGTIDMEWEKVRISFNVEVPTDAVMMDDIDAALNPSARIYGRAARYCLEAKVHLDDGLTWAAQADERSEHWYYSWLHAELLNSNGHYKEAYEHAKKAQGVGMENPDNFFMQDRVEEMISELEEKM